MECSERRSYSERDDVKGLVVVQKSESILFYEFKNVKALSVLAHILAYDYGIDKLSSIYGELSNIKQRSSLKSMAKFLVWGVPFVFTLAQFLTLNRVNILGFEILWFHPLILLFVGRFVVWGWVRSKRSTKENIFFASISILVYAGIIIGVAYVWTWLGEPIHVEPSTAMVVVLIVWGISAIAFSLSPQTRRHLSKRID